MHSNFFKKIGLFLLLTVVIFSISGCSMMTAENATFISLSFGTNEPFDSVNEKEIYINHDMDILELDLETKIDSGDVTIEIINISSGEVIWSEDFSEDTYTSIGLHDLKAGSEYTIRIEGNQAENLRISFVSGEKLVKNKEKPDKYSVEK